VITYVAAGFMIFGFLFVIIGAINGAGSGYGSYADTTFWLGTFIFAMGFVSCVLAMSKKSVEISA
jgi:hypothetical protein